MSTVQENKPEETQPNPKRNRRIHRTKADRLASLPT